MELVTGLVAANSATPRMNEKREEPKILKVINVTSA
jgi:hypothetical protein